MLSTQSSDPTLSRAYVPWYFRMVPDDRQQAEVLIREMYEVRRFKTNALVALDGYDGKKSVEAMTAQAKGFPAPTTLIDLSENELIQNIIKNPWDAIVLAGYTKNTTQIIEKIRIGKPELKIYAFLNVFNFITDFNPQTMGEIEFIHLFNFKDPNWLSFEKTFRTKYNMQPSPTLAYVYDGILLATKSIIKFGPDSEVLKNGFKSMEYSGITGEIKFGKLGNRANEWSLSE
jgi:ABC-type branched-subunit amino acid transport system substrate-binding protein